MSHKELIEIERQEDEAYFENSKGIHKALEGKLSPTYEQVIRKLRKEQYGR